MPRGPALNYMPNHVLAIWLLTISVVAAQQTEPASKELPTSGEAAAQFADVDAWMQEFMRSRKVPGGSLAIMVDGELKLSRGYGFADREKQESVQPGSLFRIASISKPITAVAVLRLVDEGKLKLDDRVVELLKLTPHPELLEKKKESQGERDLSWDKVTLQHLLTHTGGWDRNRSGDPMFMDKATVEAFGAALPVTHRQLIDFQFLRPLDYAPGERYAYSNFGYCLLGRVLETVSGQTYEEHVQQHVFAPLGITSARIGGTLESERAEDEVKYYTIDDYRAEAVFGPNIGGDGVPGQYGGWNQRLLDSHGGWIMSTVDLVKFGAALDEIDDGQAIRGGLLKPETARAMFTAQVPLKHGSQSKLPGYGYGWSVGTVDDTPLVQHGGALPCTAAMLGRLDNNIWFAALFNLGKTSDGKWLQGGLDQELGKRVKAALANKPSEEPKQ